MRPTLFVAAGLVTAAAFGFSASPALAQAVEIGSKPSVQDITSALAPKPGGARTRAIVFGNSQQPVHAPPPPPTARFRIEFELNSAELTPAAMQTLSVLGQALAGNELSQFRFKIAGHTDARGSDELNSSLSVRRAESVRRYLSDNFGIAPARLIPEGYGSTQPLDPNHPMDGRNRRVEVINIGAN